MEESSYNTAVGVSLAGGVVVGVLFGVVGTLLVIFIIMRKKIVNKDKGL